MAVEQFLKGATRGRTLRREEAGFPRALRSAPGVAPTRSLKSDVKQRTQPCSASFANAAE